MRSSALERRLLGVNGLGRLTREFSQRTCLSDVVIVLFLVVLVAAIWFPRMLGPLDLRWDAGAYYVLGTALAEGKGYRLLNEPGEIEAVQYPPLLPVIIAIHQLALGTNDPVVVGRWLRLFFFLIFAGYIFAGYFVFRRFLSAPCALIAVLIVALSLYTVLVSDWCFTELPFALVTMLFVLSNSRGDGPLPRLFAAGSAIAAYLLRTAGIALLVAWIGEAALRQQYRKAILRLTLALLPVLAWYGYILRVEASDAYLHPAYSYQRADYLFYNVSYARNLSYKDPLRPEFGKTSPREAIARLHQNLTRTPASLGESVSATQEYWQLFLEWILGPVKQLPGTWRILKMGPDVFVLLLGGSVLVGVVLQFIRGSLLIPLYTAVYILLVCVNPWPELYWSRYWVPLIPFLALSLVECLLAVRRLASKGPLGHVKWLGNMVLPVVLGLVFTVQGLALYDLYVRSSGEAVSYDRHGRPIRYRLFWYGNEDRDLAQALDWLKATAKPGDIIATPLPHWAYLRTDLKAVMAPSERDPRKMQELLDSVPAAYVVVAQAGVDHTRDYTLPLLRGSPDRWAHVYTARGGGLYVYRRIHSERPEATSQ